MRQDSQELQQAAHGTRYATAEIPPAGGEGTEQPPRRAPTPTLTEQLLGGEGRPRARPQVYWLGLVVLVGGLLANVVILANQVTSLVQTVFAAVPLGLIGIGLERVGRGVGRSSLRMVGGLLLVSALAAPVVLSVSTSSPTALVSVSAPVPPRVSEGLLRARPGSGSLRLGSGGVALYEGELRNPGKPMASASTSGQAAVVDLAAPARRGLLARNRGSDWRVRLATALPWQVEVEAGTLTADLDLRSLDVRRVRVDAGVARLAVRLGTPAGEVPVDLQVSAGLVDIYLPQEVRAEVVVDTLAVTNFRQAGLVRQGGAWVTPGGGEGRGRYRITVTAAGARVRVYRS